MNQYCEYCAEASPYGDGYCYCNEKNMIMTEAKGRKTNSCKHFRFVEISVFEPGRMYKPRKPYKLRSNDGKQETMTL